MMDKRPHVRHPRASSHLNRFQSRAARRLVLRAVKELVLGTTEALGRRDAQVADLCSTAYLTARDLRRRIRAAGARLDLASAPCMQTTAANGWFHAAVPADPRARPSSSATFSVRGSSRALVYASPKLLARAFTHRRCSCTPTAADGPGTARCAQCSRVWRRSTSTPGDRPRSGRVFASPRPAHPGGARMPTAMP